MKQKRTFVTVLLVLALLCLGIAYAAITGVDLTISGNVAATVGEGSIDVVFTNAKVANKPEGATATATIDTEDTTNRTAKINVSNLTTAGQTVTAVYTIENKTTDIAATLGESTTLPVTFDNTDWFDVTCTLSGTELGKYSADADTDTQTATVVVTLLKTPVTDADAAVAQDEITITIDAEPVANN